MLRAISKTIPLWNCNWVFFAWKEVVTERRLDAEKKVLQHLFKIITIHFLIELILLILLKKHVRIIILNVRSCGENQILPYILMRHFSISYPLCPNLNKSYWSQIFRVVAETLLRFTMVHTFNSRSTGWKILSRWEAA